MFDLVIQTGRDKSAGGRVVAADGKREQNVERKTDRAASRAFESIQEVMNRCDQYTHHNKKKTLPVLKDNFEYIEKVQQVQDSHYDALVDLIDRNQNSVLQKKMQQSLENKQNESALREKVEGGNEVNEGSKLN